MFLKDTLNQKNFGFDVVADARDGQEALELVDTVHPDLILTDISMPRMDGVELIRKLRENGFDGAVVALSCHDDFALVKSAMQYGADDYLLKNHLDEHSFGQLLQEIRKKVKERQATISEQEQLQSLAQVGRQSIRREFLLRLLSQSSNREEMNRLWNQSDLKNRYRRCAVQLFRPCHCDAGQKNMFFEFCSQQAQMQQQEDVLLTQDMCAILVDLTAVPSAADGTHQLHAITHAARHFAHQYLDIDVICTQSTVCQGRLALAQAIRQAYDLQQYGFYAAGLYVYGEQSPLCEVLPETATHFVQMLPKFLQTETAEGLAQGFAAACDACAATRVRPGIALHWLRQCDQAANVHREEQFYANLHFFEQYQTCLTAYEQQRQLLQSQVLSVDYSPAIRDAIWYIGTHFAESIGLEPVARYVNLSPSYLSALFKKEVGIGFSEYVLTERLRHVCEQLQSSHSTVKQISETAGFPDYQHFCKTFKKRIGVSPTQYRAEHATKKHTVL